MIPEAVHVILPSDRYPEWDAFVRKHPLGTVHHLSGWVRVASSALGVESAIIAVTGADGGIRAGLPLYLVKKLSASHSTNGLFGAHASLLLDEGSGDREAMRDVLDGAIRFARTGAAKYLHLKALEGPSGKFDFQHPSYYRDDSWVTSLLDLREGARAVLQRATPDLQSSVSDALGIVGSDESGVSWGAGDDEAQCFYSVYSEACHREGLPSRGETFVREVLREFSADHAGSAVGSDASILLLRWEDRIAASALVVWYGGVAYPVLTAVDEVFSAVGAADLLIWEILLESERRKCEWLDFGAALRGSPELDSWRGWVPETYPVASYVYSESGERVDFGTRVGTRIWKKLPRRAVEWLGPKVVL